VDGEGAEAPRSFGESFYPRPEGRGNQVRHTSLFIIRSSAFDLAVNSRLFLSSCCRTVGLSDIHPLRLSQKYYRRFELRVKLSNIDDFRRLNVVEMAFRPTFRTASNNRVSGCRTGGLSDIHPFRQIICRRIGATPTHFGVRSWLFDVRYYQVVRSLEYPISDTEC